MKFIKVYYKVVLFTVIMAGCQHKSVPDISDIHVKPVIQRLDLALMQADTTHIDSAIQRLNRQFPRFFDFYLSAIAEIGHPADTNPRIIGGFHQYLSNVYTRQLFDSIKAKLHDISPFEKEFTQACQYYHYYFPKAPIPTAVIYADGFSYSAVTPNDSIVGLAAEMYLGENFNIYTRLPDPLPHYITRMCKPAYMARNAMYDIATADYPFDEEGRNMLEIMINNGKLLYFLQQVMPHTSDTILSTFSQKQLAFCTRNESEFWKFFVKENLLYNANSKDISKYIHPGPECITPDCQPYNLGTWIGWQIIQKYMDKNPKVTLPDLMRMNNAQYILQQSGYRP